MGVQINGDTGNISATKADYSGNVTIGGTLTYEDVTNIDSVGLVTARSGIEIGARPGVAASISVDGNAIFSGISTFSNTTTSSAPTNGSVQFDGGVGIVKNLHVGGELAVTSTLPKITLTDSDSGDAYQLRNNTGSFAVRNATDSRSDITVDGDGKVGINATSPDCMLHVVKASAGTMSADGNAVLALENNNHCVLNMMSPADKSSYIMMGDPDDNNAGQIRYDNNINALLIEVNGSERLRISSDGYVGIGTDTPLNPLEVVGSSPDIVIYDTDAYNQNTNGGAVAFAGKDSAGVRKTFADVRGVANGSNIGEFAIRTRRTGGTLTEAIRVDSAGKTIIKVSDNNTSRVNATHLQIQNSDFSASACAGIMLAASNGANSEFNIVTQKHSSGTGADFHLDNGTDAMIQISGDNGDIKFGVNGTMINTFTPGNGNTTTGVGVEPRNGSIFLSRSDGPVVFSNRNSHGEIHRFTKDGSSVGSISTNANSLPSDKNFKKNISDLDLGLSLVNKLKPSQFNYKIDDPNTPVMYGLIAQELEESLTSEGVTKNSTQLIQHRPTDNDKESDYDVDYAKLIPVLINAIKELSTEIETLKAEVAALKSS